MLEYRGYGLSQGTPSEEGLYMDARAGIDYLFSRTDINTNEIIVFGRSLGIEFRSYYIKFLRTLNFFTNYFTNTYNN